MSRKAGKENMAVISEAKEKPTRGEVAGGRLAKTALLAIVTATLLIFAVLPLQAQTETVLYSFTGAVTSGPDGANPGANLLRDASGNLYGTTQSGGTSGNGTVFELVYSNGSYTEKVLYSFAGATANDGALPLAGLVMDSSGNLFGTTSIGGASENGIVFELVSISGSYEEKVLHSFLGELNGDGSGPQAGLVMDSHGNLFGTTVVGGSSGDGTVFELVNSSGNFTEKTLYSFKGGDDGGLPYAGLIVDASGNLYGTTSLGGASGTGTVFELVNSSGTYTETVLYSFSATGSDGRGPIAGVIADSLGNLYGTTQFGGSSTACGTKLGCGVVFELAFSSGNYTQHVLHTFTGLSGGDGGTPLGLVMDSLGNLYGVTEVGGALNTSDTCVYGCGTVFEVLYSPQGYSETILYTFPTFAADGLVPDAALVMDSSDHLYGITSSGGFTTPAGGGVQTACPSGCGTVFEITHGPPQQTYVFSATTGSGQSAATGAAFAFPLEVTVQDANGNPPATPVTVTFTANPASGGASGTFANGTATTTTPTNASGVASSTTFTANAIAGTYNVTASAPNVSGTANFLLTNTTVPVNTTTTFTTSSSFHGQSLPAGVALVGNPVTVNFTVKSASGNAIPTGTVIVTDGGLGDTCAPSSAPLNTSGQGSCAVTIATFPQGGQTSLTAAYTSNSNAFLSSTSSALIEQVVEGVVPCGAAIAPVTVQQKASVTATFTVCLAGNLNLGAVPLAVHVLECLPFAQCSVTITPLANEPGVYTVSVKMTTSDAGNGTASSPFLVTRRGPGTWPPVFLALATLLAMLTTFLLARRTRGFRRLVCSAALILAFLLAGISGCGGGSTSSAGLTPLGPAVVNLNVVAGAFSANVAVNVMVTK